MVRRHLPDRRASFTQEVTIDGQKFLLTFGEYDDGALGELWVETDHTDGTFAGGVLGTLARSVSIAIQNETPLSQVISMFRGLCYPPCGEVKGSVACTEASSVADWVAQEIEYWYDTSVGRP